MWMGGRGGGGRGGVGAPAPATAKRVKTTHGITFSRRSSPPVVVACTKPDGETDAYLIAEHGIHSHDVEVDRKEIFKISLSPVFPACRVLANVVAVQQEMTAPPSRRESDEGFVVTEDATEDMPSFGGGRETGRGKKKLRRDDRLNQVGANLAFRHGAGSAKCHISMGSQDEAVEAKVDSTASLVRCAYDDNEKTFETDNAGM